MPLGVNGPPPAPHPVLRLYSPESAVLPKPNQFLVMPVCISH
jgi:hypothetical protein